MTNQNRIPPLAGLAAYPVAAIVGYDVNANVQRLLRYAWLEKGAMDMGLRWLAPTPEWEVKEALGLHLSLDARHVAALRTRIGEMRSPLPRMDVSPDPALDRFLAEAAAAEDTLDKLVALYGVLRPALLAAYHQHCAETNPIADQPTRYALRHIILDETDALTWGEAALSALCATPDDEARAAAWQAHLVRFLDAAGGIAGVSPRPAEPPASRPQPVPATEFLPQRDARFALAGNFLSPQRQVSLDETVPLDERTLALMCRRIVEMDVPEYMSRIIAEADGAPWEYYVDMTRQLWDEVRHAMLGTIYFEQRNVDWKRHIAIHPGMSLRLHTVTRDQAHLVLYAIEQNLMPGSTGKRLEYEVSRNAGDPLAAQIQDYDWADEVLHVHIGRKWLLPALGLQPEEAVRQGWEIRRTTANVLDAYAAPDAQTNWWPPFVQLVLGRPTAVKQFALVRL